MGWKLNSLFFPSQLLTSPRVKQRILVSKNVCHGVVYNMDFHKRLAPFYQDTKGKKIFPQRDIGMVMEGRI